MQEKKKPVISASEIGAYCFCPRAWGLEKRGYRSANRKALDDGTEFHREYGKRETLIRDLKIITVFIILLLLLLLLRNLIR